MTGTGEDEGVNFVATKFFIEDLCKKCELGDTDARDVLEVTVSRFAKFIRIAIRELNANLS